MQLKRSNWSWRSGLSPRCIFAAEKAYQRCSNPQDRSAGWSRGGPKARECWVVLSKRFRVLRLNQFRRYIVNIKPVSVVSADEEKCKYVTFSAQKPRASPPASHTMRACSLQGTRTSGGGSGPRSSCSGGGTVQNIALILISSVVNMPQSLRGQDWARVANGLALVRPPACAARAINLDPFAFRSSSMLQRKFRNTVHPTCSNQRQGVRQLLTRSATCSSSCPTSGPRFAAPLQLQLLGNEMMPLQLRPSNLV